MGAAFLQNIMGVPQGSRNGQLSEFMSMIGNNFLPADDLMWSQPLSQESYKINEWYSKK